ncbi:MAG: hypothetical protein PF694_09195 [Bacteroidetes bacterium]|jgi:CO/xanthine dehydrogenase Mo-binding subunit|nr:hypothetical protein [Bacteroidota bacterium]
MDEIAVQIEEYAGLFLTIDEIALLLSIDQAELRREIRHGKSERARAYLRGKLKTVVEIRKQTVMFAKKGSPAAESLVNGYIIKQQQNE